MLKDEKTRYTKPDEEYYKTQVKLLNSIFNSFINEKGYNQEYIYIDSDSILDIITRIDKREDYFTYFHNIKINEFKRGAITCYWINKLRPFHYIMPKGKETDEARTIAKSINESFCCYLIISIIQTFCPELLEDKKLKFTKKFIKDLEYSLRYRNLNKEALILYLEQFLYTHWVIAAK